ncbi:MAG: (2Fe-2S) ferredoxin domain-containing protein [Bacteroidales bacterium]|jgi:NADH:ubiquinone oxidoreductase subunit E
MIINICIGSSCHIKGAYNVIQTLQHLIEERGLYDYVTLKAAFCMRRCEKGVSVSVNSVSVDNENYSVNPENVIDFFDNTIVPILNEELKKS